MSSKDDQHNVDQQYEALIKGLGTRSSTNICAASYIYSQLNGFPRKGEFKFEDGYGMISESVLSDLATSVPDSFYEDYPEFETQEEAGEFLSEYDDLDLIAVHLYEAEADGDIHGWHEANRDDNRKEIEADLEEIRDELEQ